MKGFAGFLAKILESRESGLLKNVLMGAGLTFGSTIFITTTIQSYIAKIQGDAYSMPAEMLMLMGLSNVDYGLSVILSAVVARATMNASGVFLKRMQQ